MRRGDNDSNFMGEKKINIAIVGLGFGAEFIPIYQKHPNANMYAICQRTESALNEIGDKFGVEKRYQDYNELLADPEVEAVFNEMDRQSLGHVERFIEQFRDNLRITDIKTAAHVVSAAVEEIICSITIFGDGQDADRLIDGLADMIHRYLFD